METQQREQNSKEQSSSKQRVTETQQPQAQKQSKETIYLWKTHRDFQQDALVSTANP